MIVCFTLMLRRFKTISASLGLNRSQTLNKNWNAFIITNRWKTEKQELDFLNNLLNHCSSNRRGNVLPRTQRRIWYVSFARSVCGCKRRYLRDLESGWSLRDIIYIYISFLFSASLFHLLWIKGDSDDFIKSQWIIKSPLIRS